MIYWVNDAKTGRFLASARSYEHALTIQNELWTKQHIDSVIVRDDAVATD